MTRTTEWYEEQAARAPWRGTVGGREAYLDRFRGKWEICCRVQARGTGVIMFALSNREAIRKLAEAVKPPIPDKILVQAMKKATRDEPIRRPKRRKSLLAFFLIALLAGAAYVLLYRPDLIDALKNAM